MPKRKPKRLFPWLSQGRKTGSATQDFSPKETQKGAPILDLFNTSGVGALFFVLIVKFRQLLQPEDFGGDPGKMIPAGCPASPNCQPSAAFLICPRLLGEKGQPTKTGPGTKMQSMPRFFEFRFMPAAITAAVPVSSTADDPSPEFPPEGTGSPAPGIFPDKECGRQAVPPAPHGDRAAAIPSAAIYSLPRR